MELAVFLIFAGLAVVSSLLVVTHRNPVFSVLSLVVTLVSLAVLFVLLGSPFLAAVQVLVYTGAILVLFLFVIMLLNIGREEPGSGGRGQKVAAGIAGALFGGILMLLLWGAYGGQSVPPVDESLVQLQPLARQLLSTYLLPFEMVGLLLLAAVIAATVLARRGDPGGETRR
ncbi:MAG: NADH-quinone oxidoreductase subunit J [Thermoanaerobaculia bacterium]|nr:NADH-quinone oxidoreductase subunit J [Thermoanaerobaculia bacterium]